MSVEARRSNNAIDIEGVGQTVRALKAFTPDIHKALNKTIRKALKLTQTRAEGLYGNGSWSIRINLKNILGSIGTTSGSMPRGTRWSDAPPGVKAAIFEFAGSAGNGKTPQAEGLIRSLDARYGEKTGRFLWEAWDETGDKALGLIRAEVKAAEKKLQAKLDAEGVTY